MTNDKGGRQKAASFSLHLRRTLGFCLGAYIMGLGIALTTNANLGTTPISSLPYVCTFLTPLSFGSLTFCINALMVVAQKLLLGPAFEKKALLQLPAVLVFSLFIDLNMWLTKTFITNVYALQMGMCVLGSFVLAVGITLCVLSNATVMPGEGVVLAIAHVVRIDFGRIKVIFDCSLVLLAAVVSLAVLHRLEGLREGTVVSAVLTGTFVRFLYPRAAGRLMPFFAARETEKGTA